MARRRPADDMTRPEKGVKRPRPSRPVARPARARARPARPAAGARPLMLGYPLGVCAESPCDGRSGGAILSEPSAPGRTRVDPRTRPRTGYPEPSLAGAPDVPRVLRGPRSPSRIAVTVAIIQPTFIKDHDRIEWTRSRSGAPPSASSRSRSRPPTSRPGCKDTAARRRRRQRFRIAVPNGFAKDWLETRYRSLISQTLARIVGYSVQVEFVVVADERRRRRTAPTRRPRRASAPQVRLEPTRVGGEGGGDATSTRATRSRTSSSARPTASPTPRACRSRSAPATPTTRSSCTAASASARPT